MWRHVRLSPRLLARTITSSSSSSRPRHDGRDLPNTIAALLTAHPQHPPPPHIVSQLSHLLPRLTPYLANITLRLLLRHRDLQPARTFLRSAAPILPDHAFTALILAHSRADQLQHAITAFNQIPCPGVYPYNALLSALLRRGRTHAAARLYTAMLRTGVPPNTCTFNTLIRGFYLNSMTDEALRYFQDMSQQGVRANIGTYNTLLDGLCRNGLVSNARSLFDGMRTKSTNLTPNVVSYTIMIRGHLEKRQCCEALELFDEMNGNARIEPSQVTYNTLVRGLCESGRMDMVTGVLDRPGCKPNAVTFNTLIAAHCNAGDICKALQVFDQMLRSRVETDSASYSTLIQALCRSGDFVRAEELVDELLEKGVLARPGGSLPVASAYNPVFEYLCGSGKLDKARRLFQELLEWKGKVEAVTFKILILGHCKEGAFEEGYKLLTTMTRSLRPDTQTLMVLIEGCLGTEKPMLAWNALKKMSSCENMPDTSTFHVVLASLLNKGGCAERAGDLVKILLGRKITQNVELSMDVVSALFRNGLRDRALEIVRLIYDSGYSLKMENLVECLCQDQKFMDARELLLFYLEKHENLDSKLYDVVVQGLSLTGSAPEAFELFYEINQKDGGYVISEGLEDLQCALRAMGKLIEADFVSKQLMRANTQSTVS